jgi:hypothetical protein
MRTETITRTFYTFEELTEEQQKKAVELVREREEEHLNNWGLPFQREALASILEGCKFFGYELKKYSFDFSGYSSSDWTLKYEYDNEPENLKTTLRSVTNAFNLFLFDCKEYKKNGKSRKSRILSKAKDCPFTGVCYDEDFLDPFREFLKKPYDTTLRELVDDGINAVLKDTASEWKYQIGEEAARERIESEGTEFELDEDGDITIC